MNKMVKSAIRIIGVGIALVVAGCGGYDESTPEGFYKAYVDAWASSNFEKVLSMHFVTDGRPNGMDYSCAYVESEIKGWEDDESGKTPMNACKKTLREMDGVYYSQNDDNIKVMNAVKEKPMLPEA